MPMQLRWRSSGGNPPRTRGNSKLACSVARTSGMSRRIIQRIWTRNWVFGVGTVLIEPPSIHGTNGTGPAATARGRVAGSNCGTGAGTEQNEGIAPGRRRGSPACGRHARSEADSSEASDTCQGRFRSSSRRGGRPRARPGPVSAARTAILRIMSDKAENSNSSRPGPVPLISGCEVLRRHPGRSSRHSLGTISASGIKFNKTTYGD